MGPKIVTDEKQLRFLALVDSLQPLHVRVRLNRNQRVLLSLRRQRSGVMVVSLHGDLLAHPQALATLPDWVRSRGRQVDPVLRDTLSLVWRRIHQRSAPTPVPDLAPLGSPVDLDAWLTRVHGQWFDHLPLPAIRWARQSPRRRLSHIRFGCYRKGPPAEILINPRLQRPWIAQVFLEHVIHHELCHHAQACMPVRGEKAHSRRFRQLERGYPHHAEALAWQRAHLHRLLADDSDATP